MYTKGAFGDDIERERERMKKKDLVLIAGVLVTALLLFFLQSGNRSEAEGALILIEVDRHEYARVALGSPQTVTIDQEDGKQNIIEVLADGAYMRFSTCENQLCVHQGQVTVDNYEFRPTQGFIICLPNRVTVELIPEAK